MLCIFVFDIQSSHENEAWALNSSPFGLAMKPPPQYFPYCELQMHFHVTTFNQQVSLGSGVGWEWEGVGGFWMLPLCLSRVAYSHMQGDEAV